MWWKGIDVATNLSFARDRVVELYFWILGVFFEPQYSFGRRILTKTICMASIIDDIYDVYGTHEELELFTDAIKRFNTSIQDPLHLHLKWIDITVQIKYYKDISSTTSLKNLNDGLLYTLSNQKNKIVTMKWIFSISSKMENIIFQGHIFTSKDVSLIVKILIKPILANR